MTVTPAEGTAAAAPARVWAILRRGTPREGLSLTTVATVAGASSSSLPAPSPPPTGANLQVRITHAGLNPADVFYMSVLPAWLPFRWHPTPGLDFVATVEAFGPAVPAPYRDAGAVVCGSLGVAQVFFGAGTLSADLITIPAHLVALKPDRITDAQATACGVAGQTAAMILREAGPLAAEGRRALVNGASGGVGSILAQVLKSQGVTVVGVCSGSNAQVVKDLGVDEVVDYTAHKDMYQYLSETYGGSQFDLIVDCVGDDLLYTQCPAYLQPQGKFLSIVGGKSQGVYQTVMYRLRPAFLGAPPRTYKILGLAPCGEYAREVAAWIEQGKLRTVLVDSEYAMEDVVEAYEKLATKRARGKIVVKVQS
ncbi:hypothetical protein BX600DRAFT_544680 [Xylariales sp. PMI_506]|nr:hypothetical protein BX600DRAFT_544680 [Xylariales sp. PMI_506]